MKSLKILMICSAIIFVSACNNDDDDADNGVNNTPGFNEFARDVFAQSANSEPKEVTLGDTFQASASDDQLDFSDLLN